MSKFRNWVGYIYLLLWMIYYLQLLLMIRGIVAQAVFLLLMAMSFYAFFQVNMYYRSNSYLKWLTLMVMILSVYGIVPIIGGWTLIGNDKGGASWMTYVYIQQIYVSVMPIFAFYYYALTKRIASERLIYIFISLVAFTLLFYFQEFMEVTTNTNQEEITNNVGFFFVPLIPMLQLIKIKDIWRYLSIAGIFVFLLMSMKRGAILAGGVMVVMSMMHHFRNVSWKRASYIICLSAIVGLVVYHMAVDLYADSSYFQHRVEQTLTGDSSGRDFLYSHYLTYFVERTSALEFLIGNGANATMVLFGQYAHNDWLEFAINQGVLGVSMYLIYWILFANEWKNIQDNERCKNVLGDLMVAYLLVSLYSMSFDNMPFAATLCIGYCMAEGNRPYKLKHDNKEKAHLYLGR